MAFSVGVIVGVTFAIALGPPIFCALFLYFFYKYQDAGNEGPGSGHEVGMGFIRFYSLICLAICTGVCIIAALIFGLVVGLT